MASVEGLDRKCKYTTQPVTPTPSGKSGRPSKDSARASASTSFIAVKGGRSWGPKGGTRSGESMRGVRRRGH